MTSSAQGVPTAATPSAPVPGPPARQGGANTADEQSATDDRAVLSGLVDRPLSDHADVFEQVHAELQAALADIDHA